MPTKSVEVVFAELAWLRQTAMRLLAGEVSYTGWGGAETMQHTQSFLDLRETLRVMRPDVFGDMDELRFAITIANQKAVLRHMRNEIERLFLIGAASGLCQPLPPIDLHVLPPASGWRSHVWKILVGLIVAYLVYRFGWNK
jgi:hypothetical protein